MPAEQDVFSAHSASGWTLLDLWLQLANINYWIRANPGTACLPGGAAEGAVELKRAAAVVGVRLSRRP